MLSIWLFFSFVEKKGLGVKQTCVCLVNLKRILSRCKNVPHFRPFFKLIYVRNSWKLVAVTTWITELLQLFFAYSDPKNCFVIPSLNVTHRMNLVALVMNVGQCKLVFCTAFLRFFTSVLIRYIENGSNRWVLIIPALRTVRSYCDDVSQRIFRLLFSYMFISFYLFLFLFYFCFYFLCTRDENFVVSSLIINFGRTQNHSTTNQFIGWNQNG